MAVPFTNPKKPVDSRWGYSRFNKLYALTFLDVADLCRFLNTKDFLTNISKLFNEPMENIISLRAYPFDIKYYHPEGSFTNLIINNVASGIQAFALSTEAQALFDVGALTIPRWHENFLDYSPYTTVDLYLPYIGFVPLEANQVMNQTFEVTYAVDFLSGKCIAYLIHQSNDTVFAMHEGNIASEIAFSGGQNAQIARNMLSVGASAVAGAVGIGATVATGGAAAPIAIASSAGLLTGTTVNAVNGMRAHVLRGGASLPNLNFYSPQHVYAIVTHPVPVYPTNYNKYYGRPCAFTRKLSVLNGFTIVDSVHMAGFSTALADEISEIERLLKNGVILTWEQ